MDSLEAYFGEMKRLLRSVKKEEGKGRSRVREGESEKKTTRGKVIKADVQGDVNAVRTEANGGDPDEEDDGLGGCECQLSSRVSPRWYPADTMIYLDGFFDAGMLLQALRANQGEKERPSDKAVGHARRAVGKKLRLSEY